MNLHPQASRQHGGPNLDLVFITQTGPKKSKEAQSQVRKHVMKDIGKARRKDGKRVVPLRFALEVPDSLESLIEPKVVEPMDSVVHPGGPRTIGTNIQLLNRHAFRPLEPNDPLNEMEHAMQQEASQQIAVTAPSIERLWTGRMDPFIRYPIKMDKYSLRLMDHVFDDRYGNTPPYRDAWLPVGLTDAATFHQVLSNAALNIASLRGRERVPETRESMVHHTKAVMLVKQNMSNKLTATSDTVIASITAFACYSHVTGNQGGWHMHMNAVKEIVNLRGGIDKLDSNRLLRMVIFWVDIGGACTEDILPFFPIPTKQLYEAIGSEYSIPPPPLAVTVSQSWLQLFPEHFEILSIMNDLRCFMAYLKTEVLLTNGMIFRHGEVAASNLLPLQHRLLGLISRNENELQRKVNILRLGCTLFMAEIRRLFGIMGILSGIHTEKLRGYMEEQMQSWGSLEILRAWVLAMGAMESRGDDRIWFFGELVKSKAELDVSSWDNLKEDFRQILWYDDVHDQVFLEVCAGVEPVVAESHLLGGSRFGGYRPLL